MSRKKKAKVPVSHAVGGPSTARGHGYQIQYAVYLALDLIVRHFAAPHRPGQIGLEPRTVDSGGAALGWDIVTDPDAVIWEAKLNATKQDVLDWLDQVRQTAASDEHLTFGLVYSQVRTPMVAGLSRLRDVALECTGAEAKFDNLAAESDHLDTVRSTFGPQFRNILSRLKFVNAPEELLRSQIHDRAQYLAGDDADQLIALLFQLFSQAAAARQEYDTTRLIDCIREQSIHLMPPPGIAFAEVPDEAQAALTVLAACPSGLRGAALAATLQMDEPVLVKALQPFLKQKVVTDDRGTFRFAGPRELQLAANPDMVAASLDALLSWLGDNETAESAGIVAKSAFDLSRIALVRRPGLALKLFQATEHVVKNLGDKHLLLEISEVCLHAANDPSPVDRDLKARAKAQAMLCGHSWVYQRTGRLPEARLWAERSERLGEDIGWERNTAFASKCRGRLDRLLASEAATHIDRVELLAESERKLRQAIEIFSQSAEFGPADRQVGDCYSLIGRTQFEAGDLPNAAESLKKAHEILVPSATKEYFDLLILTADIEAAMGPADAAERYYAGVIDAHTVGNRELSEICARAYAQRGRLRLNHGQKATGLKDLKSAACIWQSLNEHERAAEAEWAHISADGRVERKVLRMFSGIKSALVRVSAVTDYIAQLAGMKAVAHRPTPTNAQIDKLAQAARKRVAEEHPQW